MEFTCYYLKTSTYRPDNLHRSVSKSPWNSRYGTRSPGRLSYFATTVLERSCGKVMFSVSGASVRLSVYRGSPFDHCGLVQTCPLDPSGSVQTSLEKPTPFSSPRTCSLGEMGGWPSTNRPSCSGLNFSTSCHIFYKSFELSSEELNIKVSRSCKNR